MNDRLKMTFLFDLTLFLSFWICFPFFVLTKQYFFFKFTEYLFRNIGKKEKLQDIHNSNESDRFILALFMSHVFI